MIKIENIDVWGFKHAVRGMRNPMNSWDKSDSVWCDPAGCGCCPYVTECRSAVRVDYNFNFALGSADLKLMHNLYIAGSEERKFMRMIHVSMDVTAPLYWWKEYDTYKVSTVANSCSTMHKIHAKEFTLDDFSTDHLIGTVSGATDPLKYLDNVIYCLNYHRNQYINTKDKSAWWQMIQLLPSSYNQRRTLDFNYETAVQIIRQRTGHKLDEWHKFVEVLSDLPYMREIMNGQTGYGCGWVD